MARLGRRQPNKPIVVTGHPLGNPAVPTPIHAPIVRLVSKTRRVRDSGRILLPRKASPIGNPAQPTPQPQVRQTNRRQAGRIITIRPIPVVVAAAQPPAVRPIVRQTNARRPGRIIITFAPPTVHAAAAPIVHQTNARRVGRIIVGHGANVLGNPAAPTPPPQVYRTNRRQTGRIVVTRPEGQLGVPGFQAPAKPPIVHTTSARRPGRIVFTHNTPLGNPAQPTPPPRVYQTNARRPGRIVVTRPEGVLGLPGFFPAAKPAIVRSSSARRPGRILYTHNSPLGIPAQPTPKPHVYCTNRRQRGQLILLRTALLPILYDIGFLTPGDFRQNTLTEAAAAQVSLAAADFPQNTLTGGDR